MPVYKDEKRGTWYFRIRKKDIYGSTKEITRRGFSTKSEAKSEEARELLKPLEEKYDMTFSELIEKYIAYYLPRLKASSIISIKERMKNHTLIELGNKKINSISLNDYINYQQHLIKKGLAISYINTIHGNISTILKFGQKFFGLQKNVANLVGPLKDNTIKKQKQIWTPKDYEAFVNTGLEYTKDNREYRRMLVLFIIEYVLGLRVGEAQAIQHSDIDYDHGLLSITKSYSPRVHEETTPKNKNSYRVLLLPDGILSLFKQCYNEDKAIVGFNNKWFIFGWLKPFARTTLGRIRKSICKIARLPDVTNHGLRHSQASYLTNNDINKQAIAEMLGHSPEILLSTYSHTFNSTNKDLINKQNELFIPKNI